MHDSAHAHHHHHHGGHGHSHAPADFSTAFLIGIVLNSAFVVAEFTFGWFSNSIALMADAGHNLSDVLELVVAWVAAVLSKRRPTERYTYGLRGSSILAALANAVLLLIAVGAIAAESVRRLLDPEPVAGMTVLAVAAIGIVINGATAWLFASGRKGDLNVRGAYLHMMADAAVSLGVVVAALLIMATGWNWLDPVVSLAIAAVITLGTWGLLRDSTAMSLGAVPRHIDPAAVKQFIAGRAGVSDVHDLHIWPVSTTEIALTAHLVMPAGRPGDDFLVALTHDLAHDFGIAHATVQIETDPQTACGCTLTPA